MKKRFRLDNHYGWFITFIATAVLMVSFLKDSTSHVLQQMAYPVAVSLLLLLIAVISWVVRKINRGNYPIIGFKEVLVVLGGSYVITLISLLFRPEDYWIYSFTLQLVLIVSLWVRDVRGSSYLK